MTISTVTEVLFEKPRVPDYITEPKPSKPGEQLTTLHLIKAFNWFYQNVSDVKAADYLQTDVTTAKRFMTLAWSERLNSLGFTFPEKETATYNQMKQTFADFIANQQVAKAEKPKIDVKALTQEKAMKMLSELETHLNDIDPNWYELSNDVGVKPLHVQFILDEIEREKNNLTDPSIYDQMIVDLDRIRKNKVAIRTPRKRKVLKPEKIIGSLQYLKKSDEFKIESISAEAVIGAQGLWVFNTQYRSITHYVTDGPNGLTIKGTTVKGFNPDQSTNKSLRKPLEVLPLILDKTSRQARKVVDALTTKSYKPNGRINSHMILLKVDK